MSDFPATPPACPAAACGCELLAPIGQGAYGTVFLARKDGRWCAVKCVRRDPADDPSGERFAREWRGVQTAARLPPVEGFAAVRDPRMADGNDSFFYAMDLADDESGLSPSPATYRPRSLASVIDAEIALPLAECVDIGIRVASALVQLQRRHLVHRDVKPGNILFFGGKATLADVGLLADSREAASLVGTPGYTPPEGPNAPAGDVYGLGRTLWRISTGRPPADASLPPCPEAEIESPFFWQWLALLARATARDPALRHRSAKALLKDLRRLRRAMRLHRNRWLRWLAWAAAIAILVSMQSTYLAFRSWYIQGPEFRYHEKPPLPWRWAKPLFAPREDPMEVGAFHLNTPKIPPINIPEIKTPKPKSPAATKTPKSRKPRMPDVAPSEEESRP
ncbi:MAG: serine/threonine protein kinase [Kiritimatiellae bacterium]|nr:serine/threonine protein kinase [Kiritimatiellia bacterium]